MTKIRTRLARDVLPGLRQRPARSDWRAALIALPYAVLALTLGLGFGLLEPGWPDWWEVLLIPPLLILYPALLEEVVFRGVLLPRSLMDAAPLRQAGAVIGSTALFVVMHPLNHWLVSLSDTSAFTDPVFLAIVTALGLTCALQRLWTGSLWMPIATHWATVVVWNLFLGRDLSL